MFQFSGLAHALRRVIHLQCIRLSHSEIFGLMLVCSYPKLIAAYHVLHRLLVPRHPPCALIRFKYCIRLFHSGEWQEVLFPYYLFCPPRGGRTNKNCFPNMSKNFSISQFVNQTIRQLIVMLMELNHIRCLQLHLYHYFLASHPVFIG